MAGRIFIDDFSDGWFVARSPSGKQTLFFEDSDRFGPSKLNPRNGAVEPMPNKHWLWGLYQGWRNAGRPTAGIDSSPLGPIGRVAWPTPRASDPQPPASGAEQVAPVNASQVPGRAQNNASPTLSNPTAEG